MIDIHTHLGDITCIEVDAIVNAAHPTLLGGGGVDGSIHRAAGPRLLEACRALPELEEWVRCRAGESRITPAFDLPARFVIHTVGPVWRGGGFGEDLLLASCYRSSVALAVEHEAASIAFPAISCGVYGFPPERAALISVRTLRACLKGSPNELRVTLVAFDSEMLRLMQRAASASERA